MRRAFFAVVVSLFIASSASAEMRHTFFSEYNLASTSWVYDSTGATSTGDTADVFTYDKKTIFITPELLNTNNIEYRIEGRAIGDLTSWYVLDYGEIGKASNDTSKHLAIDVTELVDYLRVGLRVLASDGADRITIRGIFRKSN